jgi:hypothetical protein
MSGVTLLETPSRFKAFALAKKDMSNQPKVIRTFSLQTVPNHINSPLDKCQTRRLEFYPTHSILDMAPWTSTIGLVGLASLALVASQNVNISLPASTPISSTPLDPRLCSMSLEFQSLEYFAGELGHPNIFTHNVIENIVQRVGVPPAMRYVLIIFRRVIHYGLINNHHQNRRQYSRSHLL